MSYAQVNLIIERVLEYTADPDNCRMLRHALSYYVAANVDVDVELSVSIPISALQLLSYYRFVTNGSWSQGRWDSQRTEAQVKLLLDDAKVDLSLPARFAHLAALQGRLGAKTGAARDALGMLIKMRNVVTHPSRDQPSTFTIYEWAEAGMLARYWLCLALLNTVQYSGQIATPPTKGIRQPGGVEPAPWVSSTP